MEVFKENIEYQNPLLCLKIWKLVNNGIEYPIEWVWHYHKEVEFILVQEGGLDIHTPNKVYHLKPGDSCVIGSSQLHFGRKIGNERLVYFVLHVDLQAYFDFATQTYFRKFMEIDQPLDNLNYLLRDDEIARRELARAITSIHREIEEKPEGYELAVSMHIKHLMLVLVRHDTLGVLRTRNGTNPQLLRPVLGYVEEHLSRKIELEQVSRLANMSYSYFSKYFKKVMGVSFTEYVNRKRIQKAERLLITRDMKITEVAAEVGIENMAHFYELFRRYNGCTPKEYVLKLRSYT
jgi:AraC-like DNA-binding protein